MLWFDVTNIWDRKSPVLTGTQRTSIEILRHLVATRDDVKLFRFDRRRGTLIKVACETFDPDRPRFEPPIHTSPSWALRIARRLQRAVEGYVAAASGKRRSAYPSDGAPTQPLFQEGDVILSMSTARGHEAYAHAIADNRAREKVGYICLIYDLIPALFPQWVKEGAAERFERWVTRELEAADLVFTISAYQKSEVIRFMSGKGIAEKPVDVVYLGDEHLSGATNAVSPKTPPRFPFVLCVAALDARKNHAALYQVWRRLAAELGEQCPTLLLIGRRFMLSDDLLYQIARDPLVKDRIIHLQDVPDEELEWYYRNCLFTTFPSHYEGWGLPVAESLRHGKLCIASNAASIPEIGGNLVDYFDPVDILSCHTLVRRAIIEGGYRKTREEQIASCYRPRSWTEAGERISRRIDQMIAES